MLHHRLLVGLLTVGLFQAGCGGDEDPGAGGMPGTGGSGAGMAGATGGGPSGTGGGGVAVGTGGAGGGAATGGRGGAGGAGGGGGRGAGGADARTDGMRARDAARPVDGARGDAGTGNAANPGFSFFVVSMRALQVLSENPAGFGGDLRFGQADGLSGADEICRRAAEMGMPGAGQKNWRAFLSVTQGPGGQPVHARDRIGPGPWYDRDGRLLARNLTDLFAGARPVGGDPMLANDMTNERGEPNHRVGASGLQASNVDNHDTLTGSDTMGRLRAAGAINTCNDWTSATVAGRPYIGHSWPRSANSGRQWASDHTVPGCRPGVDATLGGSGAGGCVGCSGGYGGFYCFAAP